MNDEIQKHIELIKTRKIKTAIFRLCHVITDFFIVDHIEKEHQAKLLKLARKGEHVAHNSLINSPPKPGGEYDCELTSSYLSDRVERHKKSQVARDELKAKRLAEYAHDQSDDKHSVCKDVR